MSETINAKDIFNKAIDFLKHEDYDQALKHFIYLRKNLEEFDAKVHFYIAKCYLHLDKLDESADAFKEVITHMLRNKDKIDSVNLLESFMLLGMIEKKRNKFEEALEAYSSFLEFTKQNNLEIAEKTIHDIEAGIKECQRQLKEGPLDRKKEPAYVTKTSGKTKKKNKSKPYEPLKSIPKDEQKSEMETLWANMESKKMDIEEDSKWYIISVKWFQQWKEWAGFSHTTT